MAVLLEAVEGEYCANQGVDGDGMLRDEDGDCAHEFMSVGELRVCCRAAACVSIASVTAAATATAAAAWNIAPVQRR